MKISEQFSGSYLKASDLPTPKVFTIAGCGQATMPDGRVKPALQFAGETQSLVLNKTNAFCLAEWFGDNTDGWLNRQVELYSTQTSFSGRMVPAIRVRQPSAQQQVPVQQQFVPQMQPVPQQFAQQPVPQMQPVQQVPQPPQTAPAADYPVDA